VTLLAVSVLSYVLNFAVILVGLVLAFIVLIQRGKGGGLAGAFGGPGGSSAFGSRTSDDFTRFTLILAAVWGIIIIAQVYAVKYDSTTTELPKSTLAGQ
jgi:preprotein translocase subunit SecG